MSLVASVRFAAQQARSKLAYRILVATRNYYRRQHDRHEANDQFDRADEAMGKAVDADLHAIAVRSSANWDRLCNANKRALFESEKLKQAEAAWRDESAAISFDHG